MKARTRNTTAAQGFADARLEEAVALFVQLSDAQQAALLRYWEKRILATRVRHGTDHPQPADRPALRVVRPEPESSPPRRRATEAPLNHVATDHEGKLTR